MFLIRQKKLSQNILKLFSPSFFLIFFHWSAAYGSDDLQRFVAHAGGAVNEHLVTNSLEALNENYKAGFRFFEVDISLTKDKKFVLIHDWGKTFKRYFGKKKWPTSEKFKKLKMKHGLTHLTLDDLNDWVRRHPDAKIITDFKNRRLKVGLSYIQKNFPEQIHQYIPQIVRTQQIKMVEKMNFPMYFLALYRSKEPFHIVMRKIKRAKKLSALVVRKTRANDIFRLSRAGYFVYSHTINSWPEVEEANLLGAKGIYTDKLRSF